MRRKEKEITDRDALVSIIRSASVCRLAMVDDGRPYVVPLCFGFKDNTLYFHSANAGRKIDILRKNSQVCFEFDVDCEIEKGASPCKWGMVYRSVIGFGTATMVTDPGAKYRALDVITAQYTQTAGPFEYPESAVNATIVIQVDIQEMTGKRS